MKLDHIIEGMQTIRVQGMTDIEIPSLTSDSRAVTPGSLFVALSGGEKDGHDFIADALRRGAAAVIAEHDIESIRCHRGTPFIIVEDSRDALAFVANRFYGAPSHSMSLIGITGTNGKTTTSYIIKAILEGSGKKVGLIGTIKYIIGSTEFDARFTTPEAIEYQRLLKEMRDEGCEYVVSEVSSHALAQKRVDAVRFISAVFTNLTRDHLDFHKSMESYLAAKKRLFTDLLDVSGTAVINSDDPVSREIIRDTRGRIMTYGIHNPADVMAKDIVQDFRGVRFTVSHGGPEYGISTRLIGIPNVYNLLAAIATAHSLGIPRDIIVRAVAGMAPVIGRFESITSRDGVLFIIDYAHTPDALENLLATVEGLPHRQVITVFGCGGNRDRGKRPLMGRIASEKSDFVVITSDNPRFEDPDEIIKDITMGIAGGNFIAVTDRQEAVKEAVKRSGRGDIVVLAGKGHETYQEIKGKRHHMDDRELVQDALRSLGLN